jgi:hypothetical protein
MSFLGTVVCVLTHTSIKQVYEAYIQVPKCNSILKAGSHEYQKLRPLHIDRCMGEHTDHSPKETHLNVCILSSVWARSCFWIGVSIPHLIFPHPLSLFTLYFIIIITLIIIYQCTTLVKYICNIPTDIIYMHTYTRYTFFLNSSLFMMALSEDFFNPYESYSAGATKIPSLLRVANITLFIHHVLANKPSLALNVTGKVTDSDTVLVSCFMYSQSQY